MKHFKKFVLALFIIISTIFLCALSVSAVQNSDRLLRTYSEICHDRGVTENSIKLPSDAEFIQNTETAPASYGVSGVNRVEENEVHFTDASIINGASESSFEFNSTDYEISDAEDTLSIGMGIFIKGTEFVENSLPRIIAEFTVVLNDGDSETSYTSNVALAAGVPTVLYADLSSVETVGKISSVMLRLKYEGDAFSPSSVRITDPFFTEDLKFDFMRTSSLKTLSVVSGAVSMSENGLTLYTGSSDVVICAGREHKNSELSEENKAADTVAYCSIGVSKGSVGVAEYSSEVKASQSYVSISEDRECGMLKITSPLEDASAMLTFRSSKNEDVDLNSLMFYKTDEPCAPQPCTLTSLTVADGRLKAEGKLDENMVREHKRDSLGIYKISPIGENSEGELIGKVGISSRFSIDVPIEEYPHAKADNMFYIAIVSSSGETLRVSDSQFAAAAVPENSVVTPFGLYGADPVTVYESSASYVLFDVDLGRLFEDSASSGITVSRGGYVFSASADYLRETDDKMNSYLSSGVSVYMRIVCSSPIKSSKDGSQLTYSSALSSEFLFRADSEEAQNMYLSAVSFLCERYPHISSIVLSSGLNSSDFVGRRPTDLYKYVSEIALIARLTDGVTSEINENIFVTVPLVSGSDKNSFASPEVFSALFAERLSRLGQIPWAVMYDISDISDIGTTDNIISNLHANSITAPMFSLHTYTPSKADGIAEDYAELCGKIGTTAARIIFLSLNQSDFELSQNECRLLRQRMKTGSSVLIDGKAENVADLTLAPSGRICLWDFSSSYSAEGWGGGYGIRTFGTFTEPHDGSIYSRILRCTTNTGDSTPAGMILCTPSSGMNISYSPYIEFVFSISEGMPESAVFVFGNGENRAEYSFSFSQGRPEDDGKYHVICDLTEYGKTDTVGYIGIIIYADKNISFDLYNVSALSLTVGDEELKDIFSIPAKKKEISNERKAVITSVAFVLILSAAVSLKIASVFRKKDTDEIMSRKKSSKRSYI